MITSRAVPSGFPFRLVLAVGLTAAADLLLFDAPVGIALLLFLVLLAAGIAAANGAARAMVPVPFLVFLGALLPLVENVSLLSTLVALCGTALFALAASGRLPHGISRAAGRLAGFAAVLPFRLAFDLGAWRRARKRMNVPKSGVAGCLVWAMPLALTAVFVALFAAANPIIEHWLSLLDLQALLDLLEFRRIAFWTAVLAGVWMFLRPRLSTLRHAKPRKSAAPPPSAVLPDRLAGHLFGLAAVLRALLVFNAVFAAETLLDAAYLWGGVALPDGLTYAGYAHRGAYALVATALLAAAFILLAMRPGSAAAADGRVRMLVYLWTAQNVMLVLSSILRLDLYVGIYALTYWRVAAFVWMVLVAAGLVLIVARIAGGRSNEWLVGANLLTLSLALSICCFVDWAGLIARYNVDHSREMGGEGQGLDAWYLASLGPHAIPAMDRFLREARLAYPGVRSMLEEQRAMLAVRQQGRLRDWRAWTLRDWRLLRYLDPGVAGAGMVEPDGSGANKTRHLGM